MWLYALRLLYTKMRHRKCILCISVYLTCLVENIYIFDPCCNPRLNSDISLKLKFASESLCYKKDGEKRISLLTICTLEGIRYSWTLSVCNYKIIKHLKTCKKRKIPLWSLKKKKGSALSALVYNIHMCWKRNLE